MKRSSLFALCYAVPLGLMAQQAVFTDDFSNGSTTNKTSTPGGTPTASFTSYDIASTKTATNSPAAGHLKIGLSGATSSGFFEAQAVFTASPVTLVTVGDFITLTYTFTNSGGLLEAGVTSYLYNGLYISGGSVPVAGALANAGLTTAASSTYASGNCANWQGYVSRISAGGGSEAYTRPEQTNFVVGTSADQDLIGNAVGSGAFAFQPGVTFDTIETNSSLTLVSNSTYTVSYTIALTAAGTVTVTNNLFSGNTVNYANLIFSQTNTATGTNVLTQSFDGLSIGVRTSGSTPTTIDPIMDLASIAVSASIYGSPGPSFDVTGGGSGCSGNGFPIGLNGSVTTNVYLLYTNGVYNGTTLVGTGSALSFGAQTTIATYTVLASNTITANTGLMNGSAVIALQPAPLITSQPVPSVVTTGGVGMFAVGVSGTPLYYQWYKNGVALANANEFAGVTTSNLFIYPAGSADAANYYCIITNGCGTASISTTNSLSLDSAANLVWQGGNPNLNWDVATTLNFLNGSTPAVFHEGDNVTFNDNSPNPNVNIPGYVAAGVITENAGQSYGFGGNGILAGPGSLVMSGSGTLTISNLNSYGGGTTINGSGTLKAQNYGALGTGVVTMVSGTLELPVTGSATLGLTNNLNVTGNATLQYDQTGTYGAVVYGGISGSSGANLSIYNYNGNTATARLRLYGAATNNANITFSSLGSTVEVAPYNASGNQVYNGIISGSGHLLPRGTGVVVLNNANTFNDGTFGTILSGANLVLGADSAAANPPTIDSSPVGTGIFEIDSSLGNASIVANGTHTIGNPIQYNSTTNNMVLLLGGNLTLSGVFQIALPSDNYGTNRNIDVTNSAVVTLSGGINDNSTAGGGGISKTGGGILVLNNTNTYTGPTTNTSGFLMGNGVISGPVVVISNAVLGAGSPTTIGTLTISNNLTLNGNLLFKVNKSLSPANDKIVVTGSISAIGTNTLTVTNIGIPAFAVGDKFTLFSQPVSLGSTFVVTGGGMNWTNKLAIDGSIQALSVVSTTASYPTNVTYKINGTALTIGWPATHLGWILQQQTNTLAKGLTTASNAWFDVTSTSTGTNYGAIINPTNPTVFFRLRHP